MISFGFTYNSTHDFFPWIIYYSWISTINGHPEVAIMHGGFNKGKVYADRCTVDRDEKSWPLTL